MMPVAPVAPVALTAEWPQEPGENSRRARRRERAKHRKARRRRVMLITLGIVVAVLLAPAIIVSRRLQDPPPTAVVRSTMRSSQLVSGVAPVLPWPPGVQSAIAIPALGIDTQSGPEVPAPIASVTKLMTAYVVLTDHPLQIGEEGPSVTVTPLAVELWQEAVGSDQANIEVQVGEVLTEHQMLEGMLVHSANNIADLLAIWDDGSISGFVTKMNAAAAALGMTQTSYADASGFSTQSTSTAADQLKVATADVENPVFDQIVDMTSVTLPVGGTNGTYTPLLGTDGVVGVKSGFTSAAGGCDVLGLLQNIDGIPLEVLAVVVGAHVGENPITTAGLDALSVARPAMSDVRAFDVAPKGTPLAVATVGGHSVPVVAEADLSILAWPGQRIVESLDIGSRPTAGTAAGYPVGTVSVRSGLQRVQMTVRTGKRLPSLTLRQRIF
jgi:serine-type D-Ala-D-Ala carboxypeptidase (penicillin-binding protein 5/6)